MQVQVDPNQLRYTASLFSNGANELRQKSKRIEDILNGLLQGQHSWKGEAAKGFSTQMEKIQNEFQQKAGVLEEAVQILNQFALQMDHVNQLRNQANQLEHTLWSISGDSESAMHERQSISYQINQLQQEADWQANAADAQAMSALHSLSIPMPDFQYGVVHGNSLADELEGLPEAEQSYYRRHRNLIGDSDETNSDSADQPMDKATMTAVLIQYLKSKEPDYLPDDYRQKAAIQDFNMMYGGLSENELAATIQNIYDSEKQGQHFQQEIQSGNYDQNALIREPGYTQYAMNQAFQQDPLGGIQGILEGMGLGMAFGGGNGKENIDGSKYIDENENQTFSSKSRDDSETQKSTVTEGTDKPSVPIKTNAGSDPDNYVNQHSLKHIYDSNATSTPSKTQYGKDVDVKKLVEDTKKNPDSVEHKYQDLENGKKGVTIYSKEYGGNISTDDTPTGSHRVIDNHDKPNKSTHFPYVPRQ